MKKVERVFALLGLGWVINFLFALIFPTAYRTCHALCESFWLSLSGAARPETWILSFAAPLSMMLLGLLAGLGIRSVIVWGIKKVQRPGLC